MEAVEFSDSDLAASGQHCTALVENALAQDPVLKQKVDEEGIERIKRGLLMQSMMLMQTLSNAYVEDKERFVQLSNELLEMTDAMGVPAVSLMFKRFPGVHLLRDPSTGKYCVVYLHPTPHPQFPEPITQPPSPASSPSDDMQCQ